MYVFLTSVLVARKLSTFSLTIFVNFEELFYFKVQIIFVRVRSAVFSSLFFSFCYFGERERGGGGGLS